MMDGDENDSGKADEADTPTGCLYRAMSMGFLLFMLLLAYTLLRGMAS